MTVQYVAFTDRDSNRALLADGVAGIECTSVGPFQYPFGLYAPAGWLMDRMQDEGYEFGTVERYANGAVNIFVHKDHQVVGFVKVRRE